MPRAEPALRFRSRVCWCPPSEPALSFFGHAHRKDHPFQRTSKDEHHHKGHHKADAEGAAKAGSPAQAGAENNRRMLSGCSVEASSPVHAGVGAGRQMSASMLKQARPTWQAGGSLTHAGVGLSGCSVEAGSLTQAGAEVDRKKMMSMRMKEEVDRKKMMHAGEGGQGLMASAQTATRQAAQHKQGEDRWMWMHAAD
eukprot:1157694-Pelagomonas_calceolata.AAC.5